MVECKIVALEMKVRFFLITLKTSDGSPAK